MRISYAHFEGAVLILIDDSLYRIITRIARSTSWLLPLSSYVRLHKNIMKHHDDRSSIRSLSICPISLQSLLDSESNRRCDRSSFATAVLRVDQLELKKLKNSVLFTDT